jgi:hypothetical protein
VGVDVGVGVGVEVDVGVGVGVGVAVAVGVLVGVGVAVGVDVGGVSSGLSGGVSTGDSSGELPRANPEPTGPASSTTASKPKPIRYGDEIMDGFFITLPLGKHRLTVRSHKLAVPPDSQKRDAPNSCPSCHGSGRSPNRYGMQSRHPGRMKWGLLMPLARAMAQ